MPLRGCTSKSAALGSSIFFAKSASLVPSTLDAPSSKSPVHKSWAALADPGSVRLPGGRFPPSEVLPVRDGLQMRRIHAVADAAQMIDRHPGRDGPDAVLPHQPVDIQHLIGAGARLESGIAPPVAVTSPAPVR